MNTPKPTTLSTYRIVRVFHNSGRKLVILSGLTLHEAEAYHKNPANTFRKCGGRFWKLPVWRNYIEDENPPPVKDPWGARGT